MIDKSRSPASAPAPEFLPVPRARARHDGWTPTRQQGFIAALMDTGSVRAAAHAVNMTPEGAYALRRAPRAQSFRAAWDQALAAGIQRLEDLAMERALNGQEVPVYSYGKLVGTRRVYNDRLIMFLLRNRAAERFANAAGAQAPQRHKLERLRRQWRAEWEAEQAANSPSPAEVRASLDAKLATFARAERASMSDHTRTLYAQARAAHEEDRKRGVHNPAED